MAIYITISRTHFNNELIHEHLSGVETTGRGIAGSAEQAKQAETKAVLDGIANQMALLWPDGGRYCQTCWRQAGKRHGDQNPRSRAKYIDPASKKPGMALAAPGWMPEDKSQWAAFLIQA